MATAIPDLWPQDVVVSDVVSPLVIMRHQAGLLRQRTKNILEAEITTTALEGGRVQHEFQIVAPALDHYRLSLFRVEHRLSMPYPVKIYAPIFDDGFPLPHATASSQIEFLELIQTVFTSDSTKVAIQSLIAQVNEMNFEEAATIAG